MIQIELVSHCFCPPQLDQYSQQLRVQFASLLHWPPVTCEVRLVVCYTSTDRATNAVLVEISQWARPDNVDLWFLDLPPSHLFRRAIGRNIRAKRTDANIIWNLDCDYLFVAPCLDDVARLVDPTTPLSMPSHILIHRDHSTGDAELARMRSESLPKPDLSLFVEKRQGPCIGGVQLVGGDWARAHGYLDGTKWVQPVNPEQGFRSCRCDKAFRSHNGLSAVKLPIKGCYRQRHSVDGRDFTQDGIKVGREVW